MVFFLYIFHREDGTHPLDPSPLSLSLSLSPCLRLCVRLFGCVCLSLCLCLSHPLSLSLSLSPSHSVSNPHTSDSNAPTPPPRWTTCPWIAIVDHAESIGIIRYRWIRMENDQVREPSPTKDLSLSLCLSWKDGFLTRTSTVTFHPTRRMEKTMQQNGSVTHSFKIWETNMKPTSNAWRAGLHPRGSTFQTFSKDSLSTASSRFRPTRNHPSRPLLSGFGPPK